MTTETRHTPEPWRLDDANDLRISACMDGIGIATTSGVTPRRAYEENIANARRIVACVNACAGMSTEELEAIADISNAASAKVQHG